MEVTNVSEEQCLQRNIHNRTMEDIAMAAEQWQPTPPTYPLLDLASLLGVSKKKAKQVRIVSSCRPGIVSKRCKSKPLSDQQC